MDDTVLDDRKCFLPTCSKSGQLKTFKLQAVKKLIECAKERYDDETRNRLQAILESEADKASVEIHKNSYCSFTSKNHVNKLVAKKRKESSIDSDDPPVARIRRSQVKTFI